MSSSQEGVWISAYPNLANTWPYHDSKPMTTYLCGPGDSYHVQDWGIFPVDDLTPEDALSSEYMPDYSPVTPGSETFYFAGTDMPLHSPTFPGSDTTMFPSDSPNNQTWLDPAPRLNPNVAAQAASVLTPASTADTTTTATTSPSSVTGTRPEKPSQKPARSAVALKKPRHAAHPHLPTTVTTTTTVINLEKDTVLQLKSPPKRKQQQQQQKHLKQHHKGRLSPPRESPSPMHSPTISSEDNNINDTILRKKAHNLVEKRYRANLNSRFAALEQAILSKTATTTTTAAAAAVKRRTSRTRKTSNQNDGEMILSTRTTTTKGARAKGPSKKAAVLKNALAYIEELQCENRALRRELELLRGPDNEPKIPRYEGGRDDDDAAAAAAAAADDDDDECEDDDDYCDEESEQHWDIKGTAGSSLD